MKKDVYELSKYGLTKQYLCNAINKGNKINNANLQEFYPLSCTQRNIYYESMVSSNNLLYNVSFGLLFHELLTPSKVQMALDKLIDLHPIFKTIFKYEDGELVQSIVHDAKISLEIEHSSLDPNDLLNSFSEAFDLKIAPILRAKFYILENSTSLLLIDTHKIIVDEFSLSIILHDFCTLYNGEDINKNKLQYIDYAVWEKNFLTSDNIKSYEEFWTKSFAHQNFGVLNLPYDYTLSNVKTFTEDKTYIELSDELFSSFENVAKRLNVSPYSMFLSTLYVLLYKYTFQDNIIIGSPFSGRIFPEIQGLVGMFSDNIILNKNVDINMSFADFVKSVNKDVLDSISNQPYPYELLQKKLNFGTRNTLLDIMFDYQDIEYTVPSVNNNKPKVLISTLNSNKFNLYFEVVPSSKTLNLRFNLKLFKPSKAKSLLSHYLYILKQASRNPNLSFSDFDIITPEENRLLKKYNSSKIVTNDNSILSDFENPQIYILDKNMKRIPIGNTR